MRRVQADIEALRALREALPTFANRQADTISVAESEIHHTLSMLQESENHWRFEILRRSTSLITALPDVSASIENGYDALVAAQSHINEIIEGAAYFSGNTILGLAETIKNYLPVVSTIQQGYALIDAAQHLIVLEMWRQKVEQAILEYHPAAQHFSNVLENDLPLATVFLANRIAALESYYSEQSFTPIDVVRKGNYSVKDGVINTVRHGKAELIRVMGSIGEQIVAQVLSEKFGLQEVHFDQSKYRFDRVFRAPGMSLIVMESKVSSDGGLHLGETHSGEQGSPIWVTELVQEIVPESMPTVSIVINRVTGLSNIYSRLTSGWQLLCGSVMLDQISSRPASSNLPAEFKEGSIGRAKRKG